jgi:four helix bundle protein
MKGENIKDRTMNFALRVMNMVAVMPNGNASKVLSGQVIRSVSSAGANYRAACRSKSRRDFVHKLKIVEEELDETLYWLELIRDCEIFPLEKLSPLINENNELLSIIVKSIITAKSNGLAMERKKGVKKQEEGEIRE